MPPPLEEPIWIRAEVLRVTVVDTANAPYDFLRARIPRGVPRAYAGLIDLGIPKVGEAVRDSTLELISVSAFQPGDWFEALVYPEFILTGILKNTAFLICRTPPPPPPPPPTTCRQLPGTGVPLDLTDGEFPVWVRAEVAAVAIAGGESDDSLVLRIPPHQPLQAPAGRIDFRVAKDVAVRTAALDTIPLADVQAGDSVLALVYPKHMLSKPEMHRAFAVCRTARATADAAPED